MLIKIIKTAPNVICSHVTNTTENLDKNNFYEYCETIFQGLF